MVNKLDTKISKTVYERLLNSGEEKLPENLFESNGGCVPLIVIKKQTIGTWLRKKDLNSFVKLYENWIKCKGVTNYEVSKKGVYYRKSD